MFNYIMSNVLGCVKKRGVQKKGGVQFFYFFNVLSQQGGQGPGQGPNQLQNRKGCKADPPPEVTGDGKFYFSKIVVVSLHIDEQPYQAIWLLDYWIDSRDGPKLRYLAKNVKNFEIFLSPRSIFFSKKIIQNHLKVFFYTFQMILR